MALRMPIRINDDFSDVLADNSKPYYRFFHAVRIREP